MTLTYLQFKRAAMTTEGKSSLHPH